MKMTRKKWLFCSLVACFTGLATAFAIGLIIPSMTLREGIFICLASIAKDFLLFAKQHPPEEVLVETETKG